MSILQNFKLLGRGMVYLIDGAAGRACYAKVSQP
jgi:hypothetical protein